MEMYGNIPCVTFAELVQGGILSEPNYKKKVREGKLRVLRPGKGKGSCALIDYVSMYKPIKEAYDARNPDAVKQLREQMKEETMSDALRCDSKAIEFYRDKYRLPNGSGLTDKKQAEYVLNAQVMNEMVYVESEMKSRHAKNGFSHPKEVWEAVLGTCEKLRVLYRHTLPCNPARLREKFNVYKKHGYEVLVSGKNGNQTARKIGTMEGRLLLKFKRSIVPRYTDAQIFDEFNRQAVGRGLTAIKSITTMRNYLYDPAVEPLWHAAVFGMQSWKNKYSSLMKTSLPSMRDSLWYSDGTKLTRIAARFRQTVKYCFYFHL